MPSATFATQQRASIAGDGFKSNWKDGAERSTVMSELLLSCPAMLARHTKPLERNVLSLHRCGVRALLSRVTCRCAN